MFIIKHTLYIWNIDYILIVKPDKLFKNLGMNTSVVINMFLTQCVRKQQLPLPT